MRCSALRQLPQGSSTAHIIPHHAHFVKRTKLNSSNYFLPNTTIYSIFQQILFLYFVMMRIAPPSRRLGGAERSAYNAIRTRVPSDASTRTSSSLPCMRRAARRILRICRLSRRKNAATSGACAFDAFPTIHSARRTGKTSENRTSERTEIFIPPIPRLYRRLRCPLRPACPSRPA